MRETILAYERNKAENKKIAQITQYLGGILKFKRI